MPSGCDGGLDLESAWRWVTAAVLLLSPLPVLLSPVDFTAAWAYFATIFTVLSVPNTFFLVHEHVSRWVQPQLQLYVVRIVLMVPIYAVDCWLGLVQHGSVVADTARECYEAFVIYNFVQYLVQYFGSEVELEALLESKPPVGHLPPLDLCLPRWRMGRRYLSVCRRGALQYVVVRVATSALACACGLLQSALPWLPRFEEGNYRSLYPYLALLNACSQMWAMYCLLMFFRAVRRELAPLRPVFKFMMVKSVVFLTFWQTLALSFACHVGLIRPTATLSALELTSVISNALLCFEMFAFSLLHPLAFPAAEYALDRAEGADGAGSAAHYALHIDAAREAAPAARDTAEAPSVARLLHEALYEALVPKDVLQQVQSASWSVVSPEHLGLAGTRPSSKADLRPGAQSPPGPSPSSSGRTSGRTSPAAASPTAGAYTPPRPPAPLPRDASPEPSPGEKQARDFAAALR